MTQHKKKNHKTRWEMRKTTDLNQRHIKNLSDCKMSTDQTNLFLLEIVIELFEFVRTLCIPMSAHIEFWSIWNLVQRMEGVRMICCLLKLSYSAKPSFHHSHSSTGYSQVKLRLNPEKQPELWARIFDQVKFYNRIYGRGKEQSKDEHFSLRAMKPRPCLQILQGK